MLAQALALPFPNNGTTLKADTKLQYAGILMQARRYSQAVPLYTQVLSENRGNVASNLSAWMGLVSAYHELGQDAQAVAELKKMPPATYESALADPSFLAMLGAIYQQAGQYEIAQGLLERAAKMEIAAGGQPSMSLQLQLGRHLPDAQQQRSGDGDLSASRRRQSRTCDAWKGLIGALLATVAMRTLFIRLRQYLRPCARNLKTTSNLSKASPASTPIPATRPMPPHT